MCLMAEYEKKVRKELTGHGCTFVRHGRGDHDIWYSPISGRHITVDTRIKSRHTANAIMKQAGIDLHF
jgi:predicted RNA binding protein YcfA (HicA-like mRNA interferase family)